LRNLTINHFAARQRNLAIAIDSQLTLSLPVHDKVTITKHNLHQQQAPLLLYFTSALLSLAFASSHRPEAKERTALYRLHQQFQSGPNTVSGS
jgi:hypothetical protein